MEEILASIRRIIADDDASKAAKPPEPAASHRRCRPGSRPPPAAPAPPPAPPPPAVANSQDDIDAMLADLDAAGRADRAAASDVLDLTEAMAAPRREPGPGADLPHHRRRRPTSCSPTGARPAGRAGAAHHRRAAPAHLPRQRRRTAERPLLSTATRDRCGGGQRVQFARHTVLGQQRAHARGSGEGDAAADAQVLARRQSARAWSTASCAPRSSASRAAGPKLQRSRSRAPFELAREPQRQHQQHHGRDARTAAPR